MPEYATTDDGLLHTRYTVLNRCTPGSVHRVVAEMFDEVERFSSTHLLFGTERHELWAKESQETGSLPRCFNELPIARGVHLDHIEKEFATELVRGVVVHSRPDAISIQEQCIWDYKTVAEGLHGPQDKINRYRNSKQALFYALQLQLHGIEIKRAIYLCEVWDDEREHIKGYHSVVQDVTPEKIAEVKDWAIDRIITLKITIRQHQETNALMSA